ncbi:MAG TPA: glycoside hydrolase family 2 TIM barrel-domain containing protein [Vitreimonas sp.]|nr:glycoside hydrolase family 2 TIM barrel-domain containing protein [Vitreimonas sp.]
MRRRWAGRLALAGVAAATAGCFPSADAGDLPPTLSMSEVNGGSVAFQNGIPVPSFAQQGRARIDLSGQWRHEVVPMDADLSLTPREESLERIVEEGGGREQPDYDDRAWTPIEVPGTVNPIPDRVERSAWYRLNFRMPRLWDDRIITLKFGAANYLADVWLNGRWLGYHEGGSTPFAFDATDAARPGEQNVLAVRVDNPVWGTRNDIVPWGLADWWNFGGLIRPVWIEATSPAHVVRTDVVPHLDGADLSVVVRNGGDEPIEAGIAVEIHRAEVDEENLLNPAPRALLRSPTPIARQPLRPLALEAGEVVRLDSAFLLTGAPTWSPRSPSLHVVRVVLVVDGRIVDELHDTFGLRQVGVHADRPAVTLNGDPVTLPGVALHDQQLQREGSGPVGGGIPTPQEIRDQLDRARSVGVRLIRAGHAPANPALLDLTDRLGFAVWEEIPLYHYTPQTFELALRRGVAEQMLREMALRDMNRPSVLFHGLANESTGEDVRADALRHLHEVSKSIDGTRLTGQAAYGFNPADTTSAALDVSGWTMYHGVFYGSGAGAAADTAAALETAHRTFPDKPIVVLEFGRWADGPGGLEAQRRIFEETAPSILARRATRRVGYVSAAVWWTLEDFATLRPNIEV